VSVVCSVYNATRHWTHFAQTKGANCPTGTKTERNGDKRIKWGKTWSTGSLVGCWINLEYA
jgi:hypothetical protein